MVKISYKGGEVGQPVEDGGDVLFEQYHANLPGLASTELC